MFMQKRRSVLKQLLASVAGIAGASAVAKAADNAEAAIPSAEKEAGNITYEQNIPLFSGHTKHNGLVYIAGKGAHRALRDQGAY